MEMQFPYQQELGKRLSEICKVYFENNKSYMEKLTGIGRNSLRLLFNGEVDSPAVTDLLSIYAAIKRAPLNDQELAFEDLMLFKDWAESELPAESPACFSNTEDSLTPLQLRARLLIQQLTERLQVIMDYSEYDLYQLETALDNQEYDTEIVYRLLSDFDFPFYSCKECKGNQETCPAGQRSKQDIEDPTIGCFRRWRDKVLK